MKHVTDALARAWAVGTFAVEVKGFGFFPSPGRPARDVGGSRSAAGLGATRGTD